MKSIQNETTGTNTFAISARLAALLVGEMDKARVSKIELPNVGQPTFPKHKNGRLSINNHPGNLLCQPDDGSENPPDLHDVECFLKFAPKAFETLREMVHNVNKLAEEREQQLAHL